MFDWDEDPGAATEYLFECDEGCGDQEVAELLGAVPEAEADVLDDEPLLEKLFGADFLAALSSAG